MLVNDNVVFLLPCLSSHHYLMIEVSINPEKGSALHDAAFGKSFTLRRLFDKILIADQVSIVVLGKCKELFSGSLDD